MADKVCKWHTGTCTGIAVEDADARKFGEAITDALGCLNRLNPCRLLHCLMPCCVQGSHQQVAGAGCLHNKKLLSEVTFTLAASPLSLEGSPYVKISNLYALQTFSGLMNSSRQLTWRV